MASRSSHDGMTPDNGAMTELVRRHDPNHLAPAVKDGDGGCRLLVARKPDLTYHRRSTHRGPPLLPSALDGNRAPIASRYFRPPDTRSVSPVMYLESDEAR